MEQRVRTEEEIITEIGFQVTDAFDRTVEELSLTPDTRKKIAAQLCIVFAALSQE